VKPVTRALVNDVMRDFDLHVHRPEAPAARSVALGVAPPERWTGEPREAPAEAADMPRGAAAGSARGPESATDGAPMFGTFNRPRRFLFF
jgi:hypothetical protein